MSDPRFFRQYLDILNEGPEQVQNVQRSRDAAKWAKENPGEAALWKAGVDVATDFIPVVGQVKSAYRAGKAAMAGDAGEAGRQLVGTFVPGGRRMVSAVDAGIDVAKGDYKSAATNLSHAAGGDIGKLASAYALGSTVNNLAKAYAPADSQPTTTTTQTAQAATVQPTPITPPAPQSVNQLAQADQIKQPEQPTAEDVEETNEELDRLKQLIRK